MVPEEVVTLGEELDCCNASGEPLPRDLDFRVQDLVEDCILHTLECGEHGMLTEQPPSTVEWLAIIRCMAISQNSRPPSMPPTP